MLASVDIGTNTARLLIGEVSDDRVVHQRYHRCITRLGGGFTLNDGLAPEAMERTLGALRGFSDEIRDAGVRTVRVVGTEALRKAPNARQFADKVKAQTGLSLDIISGDEEARLSSIGVLSALFPQPERSLIFDIGGGSTEFILVEDGQVLFHKSYPLGVVRLAEDTASSEALSSAIESVTDDLSRDLAASRRKLKNGKDFDLVGTAGTVTTLAAIDMEMSEYDWRRVNNYLLGRQELLGMYHRLLPLSEREREAIPGMEKGRADLIIPGLEIVLGLMEKVDSSCLTVSDSGLLEGVMLDLARQRSI